MERSYLTSVPNKEIGLSELALEMLRLADIKYGFKKTNDIVDKAYCEEIYQLRITIGITIFEARKERQ